MSHLPLSSSSSCADNKPSKSPYSSETFFFSPLLPSQRCLVRQGWLQEPWRGCPCPSAGKYPKAVQPPEHPGRLWRPPSPAPWRGKAAGCRQELSPF